MPGGCTRRVGVARPRSACSHVLPAVLVLVWLWPIHATSAAALRAGTLLLTEHHQRAVLQFEPADGAVEVLTSHAVGTGPLLSRPTDIAIGPDALLYVSDLDLGVVRVDPASGTREVLVPLGFDPQTDRTYFGGGGVEFDSQGRLYFLDSPGAAPSSVVIMDLDTGVRELFEPFGGTGVLRTLRGFSISDLDALFLVNDDDRLLRWSATEGLFTRARMPSSSSAWRVATGPAAKRYVTVAGDDAGVWRQQLFGDLVPFSTSSVGSGPNFEPRGIDVDPAGTVYVAAASGLLRIDPATGDRLHLLEVDPSVEYFQGVHFVLEDATPRDSDGDGVADGVDVCPFSFDPDQDDLDGNGVGDACNQSEDGDGDEFSDFLDLCPADFDPAQDDTDRDGIGDACNDHVDRDGDDYRDEGDNCPETPNDQLDLDFDGLGDACDPFPFEPDNEKGQLAADLDEARAELDLCLARDAFDDADADGEEDATDACPGTPPGTAVDAAGCSLAEFCADVLAESGRLGCLLADWRGDEPVGFPGDCSPVRLDGSLACRPR